MLRSFLIIFELYVFACLGRALCSKVDGSNNIPTNSSVDEPSEALGRSPYDLDVSTDTESLVNILDDLIHAESDTRIRISWTRFRNMGAKSLLYGPCMHRIQRRDPPVFEKLLMILGMAGDASLNYVLDGIIAIVEVVEFSEQNISEHPLVTPIRLLVLDSVTQRDILSLRNLVALPKNLKDLENHRPDIWESTTITEIFPDLIKFVNHAIDDDEESITPILEFIESIHAIATRGRLLGWPINDPSTDTLVLRNLGEWVRQSIVLDDVSLHRADDYARWAPKDFLKSAGLAPAIDYIHARDLEVYDFLLQATHPRVCAWDQDEIVQTVKKFSINLCNITNSSDFIIGSSNHDGGPLDLAIAYIRSSVFRGILHGFIDFSDLVFLSLFRKSFFQSIQNRIADEEKAKIFEDLLIMSGEYARLLIQEEYLPMTPILILLEEFDDLLVASPEISIIDRFNSLNERVGKFLDGSGIRIGVLALSPVSHRQRTCLGPELVPVGIANQYEIFLIDSTIPMFQVSANRDIVAFSPHKFETIQFVPHTSGRFLRLTLSSNKTVIHDLNHECSVSLVSPTFQLYPLEQVAIDFDDERVLFWLPTYRLPRELFVASEGQIIVGHSDPVFEETGGGFKIIVITQSLDSRKDLHGYIVQVSAMGSSYIIDQFHVSETKFETVGLIGNSIYFNHQFVRFTSTVSPYSSRYFANRDSFLQRFRVNKSRIFFDEQFLVDVETLIVSPIRLLVDQKYAAIAVETESGTHLIAVDSLWNPTKNRV